MLCAICNCRNNSNNSSLSKGGISFHLFPKNITLKEKWIAATGRKNWSPTKTSTICSIHFLEEDYTLSSKIRRLNSEACPTVDVWISSKTTTKVENKKRSSQLERLRIAKEAKRKKTASNKFEKSTVKNEKKISHDDDMSSDSITPIIKSEKCSVLDPLTPRTETVETWEHSEVKAEENDHDIKNNKKIINDDGDDEDEDNEDDDDFDDTSTTPDHDTFDTIRLTSTIKKLKFQSHERLRKVRALSEVIRRLRKKDAETRDMIVTIKEKLDKRAMRTDVLSDLSSEAIHFLKHITNNEILYNNSCPTKITETVRNFARDLYRISPAAYEYVIKKFDGFLPLSKTLKEEESNSPTPI